MILNGFIFLLTLMTLNANAQNGKVKCWSNKQEVKSCNLDVAATQANELTLIRFESNNQSKLMVVAPEGFRNEVHGKTFSSSYKEAKGKYIEIKGGCTFEGDVKYEKNKKSFVYGSHSGACSDGQIIAIKRLSDIGDDWYAIR